jgi:hypothetical protein
MIETLVLLMMKEDEIAIIRETAYQILVRQKKLPLEIVLNLNDIMMKNEGKYIRIMIASILSRQKMLPTKIIQDFIPIILNKDENIFIRHEITNALKHQKMLPPDTILALCSAIEDKEAEKMSNGMPSLY